MGRPRGWLGPLGLALLLPIACSRRERPWDGSVGSSVIDESQPFLPPSRPDASLPDGSDGAADELPPISRVGGLWVSCYGGFEPTTAEPLKDLTRLTLMCGPPNGMKPLSAEPFQGRVEPGQGAGKHPFAASTGECYRVFAVAEPAVADLDLVVQSSHGTRLAADDSEDRWPVVNPDRPFCTFDDDTFTIVVSAGSGAGRYAAQVWRLPAKK